MKNLKIIAIILALLFLCACGDKKLEGNHYNFPITVDGKYKDWSDYSSMHVKIDDNGYLVSTAVSDSLLFFMFRFNDQRIARMMAMRGLHFWINAEGKKARDYGIGFRSTLAESFKENFSPDKMRNSARKPLSAINGDFYWQEGEEEYPINEMGNAHLIAETAQNNGMFCFEYSVPIGLFSNSGDAAKLIVGLEIPGISDEQRSEMMKNMRGGGAGVGGGIGGGMRGGGRSGGMRGGAGGRPSGNRPNQSMMNGQEIWLKIDLKPE